MQKLNINVSKIPKERIFRGQKGSYIDLVLFENKDGKDQYDNDGFIALDQKKEERDAGDKKIIIGNWKWIGTGAAPKPARPAPSRLPPRRDPDLDAPEDDIPF